MPYVKAPQTDLIANGTSVLANATHVQATPLNVATMLEGWVIFDFAPVDTTTPNQPTELRIEGSNQASGNEFWRTVQTYTTRVTQSVTSAVDGTENAGSTLIEEATTTGLFSTGIIYFSNTTPANSEWAEVIDVNTNVDFTIKDGLTRAQTGSSWFTQAEHWTRWINLAPLLRIRAVVFNNRGSTNRNIHVRCGLVTATDFT